jgi:hypothetical protein
MGNPFPRLFSLVFISGLFIGEDWRLKWFVFYLIAKGAKDESSEGWCFFSFIFRSSHPSRPSRLI